MATQRRVLEKLGTEDELLYWAKKNNVAMEEFPGGYYVDEWTILVQERNIVSVERRIDEPSEF